LRRSHGEDADDTLEVWLDDGDGRERRREAGQGGYGEGVTAIKSGQKPKRFPNVGEQLDQIAQEKGEIAICETCYAARGFERGEEIKGAKVGSLTNNLFVFVSASDRLVTIAR
jgi:hypothetical protein